ncbi:sortilin-related receptor [Arapaima gigas]
MIVNQSLGIIDGVCMCDVHLPRPQLSKGCSLHLAQRWSQLLNVQLRRMPILSKESAPGFIMATGNILELELYSSLRSQTVSCLMPYA